jgi:hypothetical protein
MTTTKSTHNEDFSHSQQSRKKVVVMVVMGKWRSWALVVSTETVFFYWYLFSDPVAMVSLSFVCRPHMRWWIASYNENCILGRLLDHLGVTRFGGEIALCVCGFNFTIEAWICRNFREGPSKAALCHGKITGQVVSCEIESGTLDWWKGFVKTNSAFWWHLKIF